MIVLGIEAMEYHIPLEVSALVVIILTFCVFCFSSIPRFLRRSKDRTQTKLPPPNPAGKWPLVGHLHLLNGPELPHITFSNMADKRGPIFTIQLGAHKYLIANSWEIAKECLTKNDMVFRDRPKTTAFEYMTYNSAMFSFSKYGPYWREMRKSFVEKLLANQRLMMLGHVRESEVKKWMGSIHDSWSKNKNEENKVLLDMKKFWADLTIGLTLKFIAGNTENKNMAILKTDKWREVLDEFFVMLGTTTVSDFLPYLNFWDWGGAKKAMKKAAKQMDDLLQPLLEVHEQKNLTNNDEIEKQDFIDQMLPVANRIANEFPSYDAETITKAACKSIAVGAFPMGIILTWALSLLLNNPHTLKRAQSELDVHVGTKRQVEESDIKKLVYIQAILKETHRLYPAAQLTLPRESVEDCNIAGYHIPARTRLYLNLWKIHRDPRVWPNPMEFKPERFLTTHKDVDFVGHDFGFLPYGSGRRVCPAYTYSVQIMQLALASFLHGFEISTWSNEQVDMTMGSCISNPKATPLEVFLSPRLSNDLYG